jgi:Glutamate synthase domain 2
LTAYHIKEEHRGKAQEIQYRLKLVKNYKSAVEKGIKKIMSKMGISHISSYRGAQIFEIIGLKDEGYRARIRNHGHSCFLCEIVIRSQFHTTYEPEA